MLESMMMGGGSGEKWKKSDGGCVEKAGVSNEIGA